MKHRTDETLNEKELPFNLLHILANRIKAIHSPLMKVRSLRIASISEALYISKQTVDALLCKPDVLLQKINIVLGIKWVQTV
jgi:hypothetical protein